MSENTSTRILALDLSLTSSGWCWCDDTDELVTGTLNPGDRKGARRMGWLRDRVLHLVDESAAGLVAIEGFSFGSKGRAVVDIGGLGWVVRTALWDANVPYVEVAPSLIKKFATGKGNAPKELVRDAARDRFVLRPGISGDECDAIWLWALVASACGVATVKVPKVNREAVSKVSSLLEVAADAA